MAPPLMAIARTSRLPEQDEPVSCWDPVPPRKELGVDATDPSTDPTQLGPPLTSDGQNLPTVRIFHCPVFALLEQSAFLFDELLDLSKHRFI